jgi:signal transduction histidine kinase
VFHDITTFKELDEMKSNFVHLVSHELRSPLATIKQQQAVICDGLAGPLTEKQHELLQRSQVKIQGLLELINDLLDVAKIESGHATQQQVPLQLEHILKETVGFMQSRAEARAFPETVPAAPARPGRCAQYEEVFNNLVSNAINYCPTAAGHGHRHQPRGVSGGTVSDTGSALPPKKS